MKREITILGRPCHEVTMRDNTTEIVPDDHGELTEAEWAEYCRMTTSTAARLAARRKATNLAAFNRDQKATANANLVAELLAACKEMVDALEPRMVEAHDSGGLAVMGIKHGDSCSLCRVRAVIARAELAKGGA